MKVHWYAYAKIVTKISILLFSHIVFQLFIIAILLFGFAVRPIPCIYLLFIYSFISQLYAFYWYQMLFFLHLFHLLFHIFRIFCRISIISGYHTPLLLFKLVFSLTFFQDKFKIVLSYFFKLSFINLALYCWYKYF